MTKTNFQVMVMAGFLRLVLVGGYVVIGGMHYLKNISERRLESGVKLMRGRFVPNRSFRHDWRYLIFNIVNWPHFYIFPSLKEEQFNDHSRVSKQAGLLFAERPLPESVSIPIVDVGTFHARVYPHEIQLQFDGSKGFRCSSTLFLSTLTTPNS